MIDKASALGNLLGRLSDLPLGHGLDLRSYKRDRSVVFVRQGEDAYMLLELGFEEARYTDVAYADLRKLIKTLLKREFPRSTKLRLYDLGPFDEAAFMAVRRKRI